MRDIEICEATDSDLLILRVFYGENVVSVSLTAEQIKDLKDELDHIR